MPDIATTEIRNNSTEQVFEYLREALALVEDLATPDDLRVALFTKAVDLLSAKQIVMTQAQSPLALGAMGLGPSRH
jgi:hypothetical protein